MATIVYLFRNEFGPGAIASLSDALMAFGMKRPLLISNRGVAAADLVGWIAAPLLPSTAHFLEVLSNPTETAVSKP